MHACCSFCLLVYIEMQILTSDTQSLTDTYTMLDSLTAEEGLRGQNILFSPFLYTI